VIETPFINTDWMPTLLELTGTGVPPRLDGISRARLLTSGAASAEPLMCWHIPHYTNQGSRPAGAIRVGHWKLVEYFDDNTVELFDLSADVSETRNLSAAQPARAAGLRTRLRNWRQAVGAQENTPNPKADPDLYKQIYVDFDATRFDPLRADEAGWKAAALWRQRMDGAIRKPGQ
jgi:arylsulfatase A